MNFQAHINLPLLGGGGGVGLELVNVFIKNLNNKKHIVGGGGGGAGY